MRFVGMQPGISMIAPVRESLIIGNCEAKAFPKPSLNIPTPVHPPNGHSPLHWLSVIPTSAFNARLIL